MKFFSSEAEKVRGLFSTPTLFQYSSQITTWNNKSRKDNKRDINSEEIKLSLFANDMILCNRDPYVSTRNFPDTIN